ncbi:MAG: ABC transporter ATP-binding protein [Nitrospirae bacterium]|nr:ABC transporter ATP-binding protein [Nitrospirota bacterium]
MITKTNCDITFSSVNKDFLLGKFSDVIKNIFGFNNGCPKVKALQDITFNIPQGELLGVLGRNGAGKSTLLRVAGGIYNPDEGEIYVRKNPTAIFEMGLFGNQHLTGREFCKIYFSFRNIPRSEQKALTEDVREFSELEEYFEEPMRNYSSGMLARLLFGVITAIPAEIVLLDEILSVGDQHFQGKSYKRLIKMISKGASGIFATHDWFSAVRLCSKIIVLNKGKVEFEGTSQQAARKYLNIGSTITKRVVFRDIERLRESAFTYTNGEPFSMTFDVESAFEGPFCAGLAIEIPKHAVVVIIDNSHVVTGGTGTFRISFKFPLFPIVFNDCYLSLFLSKPRVSGQTASPEVYDQISWTSGDSIRLVNKAPQHASEAIIGRKLGWKRIR